MLGKVSENGFGPSRSWRAQTHAGRLAIAPVADGARGRSELDLERQAKYAAAPVFRSCRVLDLVWILVWILVWLGLAWLGRRRKRA